MIDEKMSRQIVPIGGRAGVLSEEPAAGRSPARDGRRSRQRRRTRLGAGGDRDRSRDVGRDHGNEQLPHPPGRRDSNGRGDVRRRRRWRRSRTLRFEAGQSAVGDIFAWFTESCVPPEYHEVGRRRGTDVHAILEEEAAKLLPGESGLLALDWWNGNRSVLVDADLRGLLVGLTLRRERLSLPRADRGDRLRHPRDHRRLRVCRRARHRIVACGGLPERNKLLMQIYADVTGREFTVAASRQTPALGSAMFGAVAAGAALGATTRSSTPRDTWRISATRPTGRCWAPRRLRGALPRVRPTPRPVRTWRRRRDEEPQDHPAAGGRGRTAHVIARLRHREDPTAFCPAGAGRDEGAVREDARRPSRRPLHPRRSIRDRGVRDTYGAAVQQLWAPDLTAGARTSSSAFPTLRRYLAHGGHYSAAIVGRYANRIAQGRFALDGAVCQCRRTTGDAFPHGGTQGFDRRVWQAASRQDQRRCRARAPLHEPRRRDGLSRARWPSTVTYTLSNETHSESTIAPRPTSRRSST